MFTGDDPTQAHIPSLSKKSLMVASKRGYSNSLCTFLQTQSTMEITQKLTKIKVIKRCFRKEKKPM